MDSVQSFSDGIRFAQRVLAENNEFCARGAPVFLRFEQLIHPSHTKPVRRRRRRGRRFATGVRQVNGRHSRRHRRLGFATGRQTGWRYFAVKPLPPVQSPGPR